MSRIAALRCVIAAAEGLSYPSGLATDGKRIFIVDMNNRRLCTTDLTGNRMVICNDISQPTLEKPLAVAYSQDCLYLTDATSNAIWKRDGSGQWGKLEGLRQLRPAVNLPGSVAVAPDQSIYFADFLNNRICVQKPGQAAEVIDSISCAKPYGIYWSQDRLLVTDTQAGRILAYRPGDIQCAKLVDRGEGFAPIAVTADEEGDIYISTGRKLYIYQIKVHSLSLLADAATWRTFGVKRLCHAGALASLSDAQLLVSDTLANCVYLLQVNKER